MCKALRAPPLTSLFFSLQCGALLYYIAAVTLHYSPLSNPTDGQLIMAYSET